MIRRMSIFFHYLNNGILPSRRPPRKCVSSSVDTLTVVDAFAGWTTTVAMRQEAVLASHLALWQMRSSLYLSYELWIKKGHPICKSLSCFNSPNDNVISQFGNLWLRGVYTPQGESKKDQTRTSLREKFFASFCSLARNCPTAHKQAALSL